MTASDQEKAELKASLTLWSWLAEMAAAERQAEQASKAKQGVR